MQFFFAKKLRNNKLAHHPWDLVPPLGNPGSATENISFCFLSDRTTFNKHQGFLASNYHDVYDESEDCHVSIPISFCLLLRLGAV